MSVIVCMKFHSLYFGFVIGGIGIIGIVFIGRRCCRFYVISTSKSWDPKNLVTIVIVVEAIT